MNLNFKHRIEIVEIVPGDGPYPGEDEEVLVTKAWAAIKTMQGRDYDSAVIAGNVGKTRFIIRYKEGIEPHMEIKHKGLYYEIESMENDDEENRTITMIGNAILPQDR
ncbi:phage head closure protein [Salicibibacter kimchii]|uniref:Head-tail adaptor protein n=1 Tax=Salicibibacter kimchii TaxID=2099786 RepID=A0A345C2J3_9BACI|nr:phage head closure protein [Salicibibacter kimchii]AXF57424.1 head-tail adaptor protein [Salicibibacter kimchii]